MKNLVYFAIAGVALVACNQADEAKTVIEKSVVEIADVEATDVATLEISGMTCEHGCGGTIRKNLIKSNAVARVQFDFESDRELNTATVSYDKSKISSDELKKIVEEINDGAYKVKSLSSESIEASNEVSESTGGGDANLELESSSIEFPNLIDIMKSIIR